MNGWELAQKISDELDREGEMKDMSDERRQGQDEAWEAAKKIYFNKYLGDAGFMFRRYSAQEAIEAVQKEIVNIGDVVRESGADKIEYTIIVTRILGDLYYGINESGEYRTVSAKNAIKTDKHYDIQTVLNSMTGVEK